MTPSSTPSRLRRRPGWLLPVVVAALTTVVAAAGMWTLAGRQHSGPAVPVAIVNADRPVTTGSGQKATTVAAGRQLAAGLSQPSEADQTPLSWQLVDADDAAAGLRDGDFYAVLTIPETFSAALTSTSGSTPEPAHLDLVSDDAASTAVAALAQLAVTQAAAGLGNAATHSFVDSTLSSLTTISTNLSTTASSAEDLAASTRKLADSSGDLAGGSASLEAGADELEDGAAEAAAGAERVATGAHDLEAGAGRLADGARRADAGAQDVSSGAAALEGGSRSLATETSRLDEGLGRLADAGGRVARGTDRVAGHARQLAAACPGAAGPRYCAQVRRLALATRVEARAVSALDTGVAVADRGAGQVASGAAELAGASSRLADGARAVAVGTEDVRQGAAELDRSAGTLASGAASAAEGTEAVADGAGANAQAAGQVAAGAQKLDDGTDQAADGAKSLADGLQDFAASVPRYTSAERATLSDVVTEPVALDARADHDATVEAGLTLVVVAAVLWLAGLMMFLTRAAVPSGTLWDQTSPVRRVLAAWLPAVAVGVLVTAVLLVLVPAAGVPIRSPLATALFCGLGVLGATAVHQALVTLAGSLGRLLGVAFGVAQVVTLGGLVPVETAPAALQSLHRVLPLPRLVDGLTQLVLGGSGDVAGASVVLVLWAVGALGVSVAVTARSRPRATTAATPGLPVLLAGRDVGRMVP